MKTPITVAYFSMEIGLDSTMPTYSGGLGVLAGDTLRAAADANLAIAGITLLSRKGYFRQRLAEDGLQREESVNWPMNDYLVLTDAQATLTLEDRDVTVRAWRYDIKGFSGHIVSVYLLDTDVEGNSDYDRTLTDHLYGGDDYYRLCQEVVLGIGGVRILRALGFAKTYRYHMNEGHSSLLALELLTEIRCKQGEPESSSDSVAEQLEQVRRRCVFTTHTPVSAGHDRFPIALAQRVLKHYEAFADCCDLIRHNDELNLTYLALASSYYVNGVAKKHRETSQKMFEGYNIQSITNGIHAATWACGPMQTLFDKKLPDWHADNASLRSAVSLPLDDVWQAHQDAKHALIKHVNKYCNAGLDHNVMTLGFARRSTQYKRATLIFSDLDRLRHIAKNCGAIQIVFAGKAHPGDTQGKELIRQIFKIKETLKTEINIAYIADYDMDIAKLMVAGVDVWLNTPLAPMEASGTSGMKAAINGVPSLSVLDGWWIEGCIEGVTGWAISDTEPHAEGEGAVVSEAEMLYRKLENIIIPMYYYNRDAYINVMRNAIAINGSFFNTERMVSQYVTKAYFR